jgi:hypothetical protein
MKTIKLIIVLIQLAKDLNDNTTMISIVVLAVMSFSVTPLEKLTTIKPGKTDIIVVNFFIYKYVIT